MMFPKLSLLLGLAVSANASSSKFYDPEEECGNEWNRGKNFDKSGDCWKIAKRMVDLQDPESGGWPKGIYKIKADEEKKRPKDMRGTMDNGATVYEIRFLATAYKNVSDNQSRKWFRNAAKKGVDFVTKSQYGNGGWPQYTRLNTNNEDSYQKAVTFNDGLHLSAMELLREVAAAKKGGSGVFDTKPFYGDRKDRAEAALRKGLDVILKAQLKDLQWEEGSGCPERIGWCAQHDQDDVTKAVAARDYEKASYSGKEGLELAGYLMDEFIERGKVPDDRIKNAVLGAYVFAKRYVIEGCEVVRYLVDDVGGSDDDYAERNCPSTPGNEKVYKDCPSDRDDDEECDKFMRVCEDPNNCPKLWPRFADLKESKPIFCERGCVDDEGWEGNDVPDGLNCVCDDRRYGYSWETNDGNGFFNKYNDWKNKLKNEKGIKIKDPKEKCFKRDAEALTCERNTKKCDFFS